jgi:hypothetical protein
MRRDSLSFSTEIARSTVFEASLEMTLYRRRKARG